MVHCPQVETPHGLCPPSSMREQGGGKRQAWLVGWDQKQGSGWRDNARFQSATVTVGLRQRTNEQPRGVWLFEERFTAMRRTEQQPGGVTDALGPSAPAAEHHPWMSPGCRNVGTSMSNVHGASRPWPTASTQALEFGVKRSPTKRVVQEDSDRFSALVLGQGPERTPFSKTRKCTFHMPIRPRHCCLVRSPVHHWLASGVHLC